MLKTIQVENWEQDFYQSVQDDAIKSLESGDVLFFPNLAFTLHTDELVLLDPKLVHPKSKNISYDASKDSVAGFAAQGDLLKAMMKRYALATQKFLKALLPSYQKSIQLAKTSFRPVEIAKRKTSYRKDDTRLHCDAFPSNPVQGDRILRLFTNINPDAKPRVWRIGEPFSDVVQKFGPRVSRPIPYLNHLLKLSGITKKLRSSYDHYMLQIHDAMKRDMHYQKAVAQEEILFQPGTSWMVFTDQVSHAALSGQHVLEQTFNLCKDGLKHPEMAPLAVLENYFRKKLL